MVKQYIVFKSHEQMFALPVSIVKRVVEFPKFIILPEVPEYVLGAVEFNNTMVPIIDFKNKLFGEKVEENPSSKVILCNWEDNSLGLLIEEIIGITELTETDYEAEIERANLKRGYVDKFLKLKDDVVISINLTYLFDNKQEDQILDALEETASEGTFDDSTEE
ncbi:MAG: chemotaxis protein CheW [Liquorilactobacillus hordei]|uniref:Chemotaxis protein CheW n=2 Tax=Liquorilactobacillus hordei TaxID=468911 RepID=A0A0A7RFR3_9LACO|nr:chemotaxis protein CheW [Liquorilactobacillus hordei]AJA34035.1 purine-binding chemotaxis protein CheW [Liquorilactobacillus hordei]AUJ30648.1 chemotaxis protein CheW [Liquorilactobacillus hordei]KRL06047.1 chemotaxis protein CheW [Liquorilactobacillus hordei DSM 19519]MBZ2405935.1 chemotaxis protein CheW [Liquorilactobacillus hordei]QYH51328.1 chemotaxis protein CheW [Liquorilactobacillus hordei DSM 19519]